MKVGYARVSCISQNLDVQEAKLRAYGCEKIFSDKHTGNTANRPELAKCREFLREGDEFVITKLDRLARSTYHLTQIAKELEEQNIELAVLDQDINTSTPIGRLLFNVLASIAEFESELRKERQMDGIARAKELGVSFGRPVKMTSQQIATMRKEREQGVKIKDLMAKYDISKASVYRLLKNYP